MLTVGHFCTLIVLSCYDLFVAVTVQLLAFHADIM